MVDAHVHCLHGHGGGYTEELLERLIAQAQVMGLDEIYLLEHTHQFREFEPAYAPVVKHSDFQRGWIARKMTGSIERYLAFIDAAKAHAHPVKVRFGLEACYLPETQDQLAAVLELYNLDFLAGAVHWIDGWGFDHKAEFWRGVDVDAVYRRYYATMVELVQSSLFTGLAHPDSIKCFGYQPTYDLADTYAEIADLLAKHATYVENSGGLALNYGFPELGMEPRLLAAVRESSVTILPASDAHRKEDVGRGIRELAAMIG